ncbi:MAG: decarboxylase [Gemmatimonadetes bacterium]|nr:decarboxylase [Gemmatimonadota bacterium]
MSTERQEALRAWFLGPRAENGDLLERLVVEALRDHIFWRRNYHPEDGFVIRETDKRSEGYDAAVARLTQELMELLASLKRGVPFFSGRYKGHMSFEQTIAAQVGYFAAMLYNPNNVAVEGSPVTTRLELEVAAQLGRMIGYDPATSWGHLTSGGTVANFEALWIARNVRYLPVAAAGAAEALGVSLEVRRPDGSEARLERLSLWEVLNVGGAEALDLWGKLWAAAPEADVRRALAEHSFVTVGYQDYSRRLAYAYGDALPAAVVLVAATAHYSWDKIVRALGIGSNQLVHVPVDERFRMDPDALWERVRELAARRVPIMACVSVCGTTEESAVDRLDLVLEVRERAERELGVTFHVHSDAAYGGYAAAVTWRADGTRRGADEIRAGVGVDWPSADWLRAMEALAGADSVTIDPHKLGYVPYPAGAFLLRDRRARELVAVDPPYLLPTQGLDSAQDLFLGRFIFEGSKPGAAAAAVWLSHAVLPLDERGYGYLVERTVAGAYRLHAALRDADLGEFRVVLLPEPDINIVCYIVTHPALEGLAAVNALNEGIYARMSLAEPGATPEYILTRTRFQTPMYDGAVRPLLERLGIPLEEWVASGPAGLVVLRSTVMDPFLAEPGGADHVAGYLAALRRAAEAALAA